MTELFTIIFGAALTACGTLHACHTTTVTPPPVEKAAPAKPVPPIAKVP